MIMFSISLKALASKPLGFVSLRWQASPVPSCAVSFKAWALQATGPQSIAGQASAVSVVVVIVVIVVISFEEFVMQSMGRSGWFALSVSQFKQSPSAYGSHIKSIPCIQPLQVRQVLPVHCRPPYLVNL